MLTLLLMIIKAPLKTTEDTRKLPPAEKIRKIGIFDRKSVFCYHVIIIVIVIITIIIIILIIVTITVTTVIDVVDDIIVVVDDIIVVVIFRVIQELITCHIKDGGLCRNSHQPLS